jgi:integrase
LSRVADYSSCFDVARLAAESGQHQALVLTLAYTGIRWGEAVPLRVRDVQFLRRRPTVADNAVQWARSELEIWPSPAAKTMAVAEGFEPYSAT